MHRYFFIFLTLLLTLYSSNIWAANSTNTSTSVPGTETTTSLTTYYPAPTGNYKQMRMTEWPAGTAPECDAAKPGDNGTIFFGLPPTNNTTNPPTTYSTHMLYYCYNGIWLNFTGNSADYWTLDSTTNHLYPTDFSHDKVGIGTTNIVGNLSVNVGGSLNGTLNFRGDPAGLGANFSGMASPGAIIQSINSDQASSEAELAIESTQLYLNPNGGNVGVGTVAPQAKLDVEGGFVHFGFNDGYTRAYPQTYTDDRLGLSIASNRSGFQAEVNLFNTYNGHASTTNEPSFLFTQMDPGGSGRDLMSINRNGNVGISTTAPNARLSVGAGSGIKELIYDAGNTDYDAGFGTDLASGMHSIDVFMGRGNGADTAFNVVSPNQGWPFTSYTPRLTVLNTGNVGIGETAPGAKLSFPNLTVSAAADGITWYSPDPLSYGIYKTAGPWTAPYQQLKLSWATGVIIDGGNAYGNSGVTIGGANPIRFSQGWTGFANGQSNTAEISNDTGSYKTLMIVGNGSAGAGRSVSVWDKLNVMGTMSFNNNPVFTFTPDLNSNYWLNSPALITPQIWSTGGNSGVPFQWGPSYPYSRLQNDQGGSIELGTGVGIPYIDFHGPGNGVAGSDFNVRIINDGDGRLEFVANQLCWNGNCNWAGGAQGPQGPQGPQGATGPQGPPGSTSVALSPEYHCPPNDGTVPGKDCDTPAGVSYKACFMVRLAVDPTAKADSGAYTYPNADGSWHMHVANGACMIRCIN